MLTENEIAKIVVDISFRIHYEWSEYGPGLFESVYEEIFCYELAKTGIPFNRQQPIAWFMKKLKWRSAVGQMC